MVYKYIFLKELFNIYLFLIQILFSCALDRIINSRATRPVNFAIHSYLIFAYHPYHPNIIIDIISFIIVKYFNIYM